MCVPIVFPSAWLYYQDVASLHVSNAHQLSVKDCGEKEKQYILQGYGFIHLYSCSYGNLLYVLYFFLVFFRVIWMKKLEKCSVCIYNITETKVSIQWRSNLASFLCSGVAFVPLHCPGFTNSKNSP